MDRKEDGLVDKIWLARGGVLAGVFEAESVGGDSSSKGDDDRDCEWRDDDRGCRFGDRKSGAPSNSDGGASTRGLPGVDFDRGAIDVSGSTGRPREASTSPFAASASSFNGPRSALPTLENHVRRLLRGIPLPTFKLAVVLKELFESLSTS